MRPYVDGQLISSELVLDIRNPATEAVVGQICAADAAMVQLALEAAQRSFSGWAAIDPAERAHWMLKLRDAVLANEDRLRTLVHLEMAKPWDATAEDWRMLADSLQYYGEQIDHFRPLPIVDRDGTHTHVITREPVGVVGAFLAWNFPLLNLAYKLGPAMATGCPIVIKPSSKTPMSAYAVGELCAEIGLPAGVVNILTGADAVVGDMISASPIPQMLTLIGSTQTGMHVMRTGSTTIKRYSMELGGDAPVLVFEDADLELAADTICALKFGNSGQICVAPNRVYAHKSIAQFLAEQIVDRARSTRVGYDRQAPIAMGPVIDGGAWKRIDGMVRETVAAGAQLLTGGGRPAGIDRGSFYAPTVVAGVTQSMPLGRDEVFGPVVSLMEPFVDEAWALAAANATQAGLTAYVFTRDAARADRCADALRFGEVQVNGVKYAINLPHVGIKQSGLGVDCSPLALDEFLVTKRVSRAVNAQDVAT